MIALRVAQGRAWYEEDDEVFVHPRDPYHRVDVMNSSRHVKVVIDGEVVAETDQPRLLFETGLRTRYYMPKVDVRMDLLEPTPTATACPYKGNAVYWSAEIGDQVFPDIVWSYPFPMPECTRIQNLLSFYNEKVDVYVEAGVAVEPEPAPRRTLRRDDPRAGAGQRLSRARCARSTGCRSTSSRARSTACSARTAPARRPPCACSAHCCGLRPGRRWWRLFGRPSSRARCARASAS